MRLIIGYCNWGVYNTSVGEYMAKIPIVKRVEIKSCLLSLSPIIKEKVIETKFN